VLSFEEALTVLSCRPTWTLDEATAWTGSDEDLLINLAMPVAVGWARVQGTGLRARAQPAPMGAIRDVWADGELVEIWGRIRTGGCVGLGSGGAGRRAGICRPWLMFC